jgi:hypothetical protein
VKQNFLNIPVSVCYLAFQNNSINELQLFCWLKTQCSGHFKLNNQLLFNGITQLGTTRQTFNRRLKWLVDKRWIGINTKTGSHHINSFKVIHRRTGNESIKGILWEYYDFKLFREFIHAAILYDLAKKKRYYDNKRLKEQGRKPVKAGILKGCSRMCNDLPSFPLPLTYAAKKLNKQPTLIARMKNAAQCAGFVQVKPVFHKIKIDLYQFDALRKFHPEGHKFIIHKGKPCEQLPDKITFLITIRHKRNLKQNKLSK